MISALLADPSIVIVRSFISELRQLQSLDFFCAYCLSVLLPHPSAVPLSTLVYTDAPTRSASPRPSSNISVLNYLSTSGVDPRPYCDAVADARAGTAVAPSTSASYDSHLN